jgi:hypothetical protein
MDDELYDLVHRMLRFVDAREVYTNGENQLLLRFFASDGRHWDCALINADDALNKPESFEVVIAKILQHMNKRGKVERTAGPLKSASIIHD